MKSISIFDLDAFDIGHAQDLEKGTGCTVILAKKGATAGVDVRGGGPATRETDLLDPKNMVEKIHAVTLSGGSAFGLEASCGVMNWLSEQGIGFDMKGVYIPIVCGASLFDCSLGDPKAYPDKEMGRLACQNASKKEQIEGNVGAGAGASVGKFFGFDKAMKTGLGIAAYEHNGIKVGAVVAVNACGDIFEPNSSTPLATAYDYSNKERWITEEKLLEITGEDSCGMNTTIGAILTNANLNKAQMNKLASMSHNAYAHCIHPVHTPNDGDTIFTLSSNEVDADLDIVAILAIKAMEQAIVHAATKATGAFGLKSYNDL